MKAEIIAIGSEMLTPYRQDSNSLRLTEKLNQIGLTVAVGSVIPPVAICVFIVKNITKSPMGLIYAGVYPFLISIITVVALLFVFPGLATSLPSVLMK